MIQIDMEMPKDCGNCPFKKNYRTNDYGCHCECEWDDEYRTINLLEHSKPKWCPLKEAPNLEDIKSEILSLKGDNFPNSYYVKIIDKHISGKGK